MNTDADLVGRAMTQTAAVTLDDNTITTGACTTTALTNTSGAPDRISSQDVTRNILLVTLASISTASIVFGLTKKKFVV